MGIFSRQSTGVYNTMSQSKKNVFGVNERFIHKEFVIECFGKNIWTILEERSQNKNQNQKGKRRTPELIKCLLDPDDTWRACTCCYDQAPQTKLITQKVLSFINHENKSLAILDFVFFGIVSKKWSNNINFFFELFYIIWYYLPVLYFAQINQL